MLAKKMSPLELKVEIRLKLEEKERIIQRIKDLEDTLSMMPADTALGILCIKSYIKRAKKELNKIEREIRELST